jgi:hypothetical protein
MFLARKGGRTRMQIGERGPARLGEDGDNLGSEAAACALVSETSEGFGQALASSETEFRTQKI